MTKYSHAQLRRLSWFDTTFQCSNVTLLSWKLQPVLNCWWKPVVQSSIHVLFIWEKRIPTILTTAAWASDLCEEEIPDVSLGSQVLLHIMYHRYEPWERQQCWMSKERPRSTRKGKSTCRWLQVRKNCLTCSWHSKLGNCWCKSSSSNIQSPLSLVFFGVGCGTLHPQKNNLKSDFFWHLKKNKKQQQGNSNLRL